MRKIIYPFLTATFMLFCSTAFTQYDIFIKAFDNNNVLINGGSTLAGHLKEFETFSYSFGVVKCSTCNADISSYNVMLSMSGGVMTLKQLSLKGLHLTRVDITYHRSANAFDFYKVHMEDVIVESVQESGSTGGDINPTISVSFLPGKIAWQYTATKTDGTEGIKTSGGWDRINAVEWLYY
jgi:type VI secretion system secreted protein Hcp